MTEPVGPQPLREIIETSPREEPPPWSHAAQFAAHTLGRRLARRIEWVALSVTLGTTGPQHEQLGILAGDDDSLTLRFEQSEPGAAQLQVQVRCPNDHTCSGPAWDSITSPDDLLTVLDGGTVEDPWCETCG
jgi:hypothetical protein